MMIVSLADMIERPARVQHDVVTVQVGGGRVPGPHDLRVMILR